MLMESECQTCHHLKFKEIEERLAVKDLWLHEHNVVPEVEKIKDKIYAQMKRNEYKCVFCIRKSKKVLKENSKYCFRVNVSIFGL